MRNSRSKRNIVRPADDAKIVRKRLREEQSAYPNRAVNGWRDLIARIEFRLSKIPGVTPESDDHAAALEIEQADLSRRLADARNELQILSALMQRQ